MTSFNYLGPRGPRAVPRGFPMLAIDNRIRGPLAVLLGSIVLTAILGCVQLARLHAAERSYSAGSVRIAADAAALGKISALRAHITSLTQLDAAVGAVRRATLANTNELVWIGNHLPEHAWLSSLRYEDGVYSLEGTSDRIAAVGAAIDALRGVADGSVPRLVSLRDDTDAAGAQFHYSLRLGAQR